MLETPVGLQSSLIVTRFNSQLVQMEDSMYSIGVCYLCCNLLTKLEVLFSDDL